MSKLYAIVDIETTGGSAGMDRITEIAIVHHNGENVTGHYSTLINPERSISPFISGLTGITNEMVKDAPKFYEVAREIIEWTEGRIFVAHNAHFDYRFIKEEFSSLGYTYTRHLLDTVKLSRLAFPGYKSYSLSNLVQQMNIPIKNRHRALGDAMATAYLFTMIMESGSFTGSSNNFLSMNIRASSLPKSISIDTILNLPEEHGVYYFRNEQNTLIYVGKSKNIKTRIARHFSDYTTKSEKIRQSTYSIDYEITGNELAALIKESIEIRKLNPIYNKAQRNNSFPYAVIADFNAEIPVLKVVKIQGENIEPNIIKFFSHIKLAEHFILQKANEITEKIRVANPSFLMEYYTDKRKDKYLIEMEIDYLDEYKNLFQDIVNNCKLWFDEDMMIVTKGRNIHEKCLFLIENGHFYGYGYFDIDQPICNIDDALGIVQRLPFHPELDMLIHTYIKKNSKDISIIKLNRGYE